MSSNTFLSIIIPAYNEEQRLPNTLEKVFAFLSEQPYPSEVLVVENGSQDRTLEIAQDFAAQCKTNYSETQHTCRVLKEEQSGKGLAVRRGMLEAQGEYRFMADADLSMPVAEIKRFIPPALTDFDIAIGSREAPGSIRYNEPAYRHFGGRAVNTMIRLLALPGLHDTQCGFKCFRAPIAEDLFRNQTLTGWSFDIEILYIARQRGYHVTELPIPWYFDSESKVNAVRDTFRMGLDILVMRRNAWQGKYNTKNGT